MTVTKKSKGAKAFEEQLLAMTPAQRVQLAFQMRAIARRKIAAGELQLSPELIAELRRTDSLLKPYEQ